MRVFIAILVFVFTLMVGFLLRVLGVNLIRFCCFAGAEIGCFGDRF